jgi:hypothetical protein
MTFARYSHDVFLVWPLSGTATMCFWNNICQGQPRRISGTTFFRDSHDVLLEWPSPGTWRRSFQKYVVTVPDKGYSRNASWLYLVRRVSGITFARYSHDVFLEYPSPWTVTTCFWNNHHQVQLRCASGITFVRDSHDVFLEWNPMTMTVSNEGYSRKTPWLSLAKVIPETHRDCPWWRLFQKHVVTVPGEGYSRNTSCLE